MEEEEDKVGGALGVGHFLLFLSISLSHLITIEFQNRKFTVGPVFLSISSYRTCIRLPVG